MRIAIIGCRGYPSFYGGFETLVRYLAPSLNEKGHSVTVYGRDSARRHEVEQVDGIDVVFTAGIDRKSTSTLTFGLSGCIDIVNRRPKVDVVLGLNVANGYFLRYLKKNGVPTCLNVDGQEWLRRKWGLIGRGVFYRGASLTTKHAEELIFDSKALRKEWEVKFGRSGTFIPYGAEVRTGIGQNRLTEEHLPESGYVLVVARIVPENNIDLLLDAIDYLPRDLPIVVVGSSNYRQRTEERLQFLSASGRIVWLGHVNDQELLMQLWANAGVYWHGHSVGGTNPALLQAMGAGAPTIALDTPFNKEVLESEEQLVRADPKGVAEKILGLIGNAETRDRYILRQREIVSYRYSWPVVCEEYSKLLESVCSEEQVI